MSEPLFSEEEIQLGLSNRDLANCTRALSIDAVDAAEVLAKEGFGLAVVSMPCWELFEKQEPKYRDKTLGTAPPIAVEAAAKFGWTRYVRTEDDVIGLDSFGASGPADQLYARFEVPKEAIVARALERIHGLEETTP